MLFLHIHLLVLHLDLHYLIIIILQFLYYFYHMLHKLQFLFLFQKNSHLPVKLIKNHPKNTNPNANVSSSILASKPQKCAENKNECIITLCFNSVRIISNCSQFAATSSNELWYFPYKLLFIIWFKSILLFSTHLRRCSWNSSTFFSRIQW